MVKSTILMERRRGLLISSKESVFEWNSPSCVKSLELSSQKKGRYTLDFVVSYFKLTNQKLRTKSSVIQVSTWSDHHPNMQFHNLKCACQWSVTDQRLLICMPEWSSLAHAL